MPASAVLFEKREDEERMDDKLQVTLFSFGFKYGLPLDATLVWDVRFLPNPYWVEAMRPRTGIDRDVADYVLSGPIGTEFLQLLRPVLRFLVEQNRASGKTEMRLAIGCTGGQHRSVAVVEALTQEFHKLPVILTVRHRDIARVGNP